MGSHHRQRTNNSDEDFSFPSTLIKEYQDPDFEFACLTPYSKSNDTYKPFPADNLFFNGHLLPHSYNFPSQSTPTMFSIDAFSRTTSRGSSVNTKDYSLMSSRSNSTNSSRSSCSTSSTARTSTSENSEKFKATMRGLSRMPSVSSHVYGSSQRWQIMAPVVPVLRRDVSTSRRKGTSDGGKKQEEKCKDVKKKGIWRRFFKSFLVACGECHAIQSCEQDDGS